MKRIIILQVVLLFLLTNAIYAQQTDPNDEVVKVTTSLVQIDTVVTDKDGNPITDLTANDFEILQDGKSQKITNVTYINRVGNSKILNQVQTSGTQKTDKNIPAPPPASTRSTELGRILTFVVDDGNCDVTQKSIAAIKEGLEKFVNEQMLPNDSVAIYQTRAGSALLQQYTSDKSLLLRIIKKIRWYPPSGICTDISGNDYLVISPKGTLKGGTFETERDVQRREAMTDSIRDTQVAGVLGVARYAIKGLRQIGGRKILFLMSDSFAIFSRKRPLQLAQNAARDLTDLANRTSVVINTIDNRGLTTAMIESRDDPSETGKIMGMMNTGPLIENRLEFDESRQSGLAFIANETGGTFYRNINNLDVPVQKALKSESGYYLIAYDPEEETFKGKNFHKIEIKLKRPNLVSSSRSGFYGVTDSELRPKPRSGDSELYDVLSAPLPNANLNIRLSANFANTKDKGNFIHALLYIDGKDINFIDGANGTKKIVFDIVAVTLNDKNEVIDDSNSTRTIQIPSNAIEEIQQKGLIYTVDVPVKKEGIYTFRIALREAAGKKIGSSSQVIEVPSLKKDKIYLSNLIMSGVDINGKMLVSGAKSENGFSTAISKSLPAIRQYRRNSIIAYSYVVYNSRLDTGSNQPKLLIQTNLYRDGQMFSEGKPQNAELEAQNDMTRINDYGYLQLNPQVPVGEYALQVIVKDLSTNQTTSQWIDFEVIE